MGDKYNIIVWIMTLYIHSIMTLYIHSNKEYINGIKTWSFCLYFFFKKMEWIMLHSYRLKHRIIYNTKWVYCIQDIDGETKINIIFCRKQKVKDTVIYTFACTWLVKKCFPILQTESDTFLQLITTKYMKLPLVVETNSHICIVKQNTGMLYVSLIN